MCMHVGGVSGVYWWVCQFTRVLFSLQQKVRAEGWTRLQNLVPRAEGGIGDRGHGGRGEGRRGRTATPADPRNREGGGTKGERGSETRSEWLVRCIQPSGNAGRTGTTITVARLEGVPEFPLLYAVDFAFERVAGSITVHDLLQSAACLALIYSRHVNATRSSGSWCFIGTLADNARNPCV